jgi:O-antigen ligase
MNPRPWRITVLLAAALAGIALAMPVALLAVLAAAVVVTAIYLVITFPVAATVLWLVVCGSMPDMWLGDFLGPEWVAPLTAAIKLPGLLLALCLGLRWGFRADPFNPAWVFGAMFLGGFAHGLYPDLPVAESLRSLLGSVAPFAFSFVALPRHWCRAVLRVTPYVPLIAVGFGIALAAAGLRPLFIGAIGARLAGSGHPAFLAGFAMAGVWAALLALVQDRRRRDVLLLLLNLVILVLTGARAPMAIALAATLAALFLVPTGGDRRWLRLRWLFLSDTLAAAAALFAAAHYGGDARILELLRGDEGGFSGRELIWPLFRAARDASPLVGWGVGAGKVLVPMDDPLAHLLGTNAAHNEYLRVAVEGGWIGLAALIAAFALWTRWHLRAAPRPARIVLWLAMLAIAVHAYTDNVLIATTTTGVFTFLSAAFGAAAPKTRDSLAEETLASRPVAAPE